MACAFLSTAASAGFVTGSSLLGSWTWSATSPAPAKKLSFSAIPGVLMVRPATSETALASTISNAAGGSEVVSVISARRGSVGKTKVVFCASAATDGEGSTGNRIYARLWGDGDMTAVDGGESTIGDQRTSLMIMFHCCRFGNPESAPRRLLVSSRSGSWMWGARRPFG